MAAVSVKPAPAEKFAAEVDEQLAQATSRIRGHDLAFGALLLLAMVLVYATAMMILDKSMDLPEWVRQASLAGLVVSAAATTYFSIVRPLLRRVNPLYAAVQVEKTIEDAKNSVLGYVEAQENGQIHPAVKAAMGARAARTVGEADINHAIDHRSLVYAGSIAVVFLLALIVLFFIFRPAQFQSLAARAFVPFSSNAIASRTQIALIEPASGDTTITAGQSIEIKVSIGGKVPSADSPDRIRAWIRHNQATPEYEELPLEQGETSREWQVRVPDYLVRNGFWYKVVGGDAETPEYRVSVRSLPLFTGYQIHYEYPAYTRLKPEISREPHLRALKGTRVVIVGKTNRSVKAGKLAFDPADRPPVAGKLLPEQPDSIQFQFTLVKNGHYRMRFTSSEGERSPEPPPFAIQVDEDQAPIVEIIKPVEAEISLPANGQLAVDAAITDDLGIDKATLKLRVAEPMNVKLSEKKFLEGKSFQRLEKDGTFSWPTNLEYKDSVDLTKLKDESGQPFTLQQGMVLEYWLEAADNRTKPSEGGPTPDPNIGKSAIKRVRIAPPIIAKEEKKSLDNQKDQRKSEEQAHNQQQQKRLDQERRNPPPPMGQQSEPKPDDPGMKPDMPPMGQPEKKGDNPMPKEPNKNGADPMMPPMGQPEKKGDNPMPKEPGKNGTDPMNGNSPNQEPGGNTDSKPETAPPPPSKDEKNLKQEADRIQQELDKQKQSGGDSKPGPESDSNRANPAEQKPNPMNGEMPPDSKPKEAPKPGNPDDPMDGSQASEPKPMGNAKQPENPASNKLEPKPNPMDGSAPSDPKNSPKSSDPMNGKPGGEKKPPMPGSQPEGDGGSAKPATEQKPEPGMKEPMPGNGKPNPAKSAAQSKPMTSSKPGQDKPEPEGSGSPQDPKSKSENNGGNAKPQKSPPPSSAKPGPKEENNSQNGEASRNKPMPKETGMGNNQGSSQTKPAGASPPMGEQPERGLDKGEPGQKNNPGQKPTPEQKKEFQDAVKDLASKDPAKQQAARDKLDKMVGQNNRKDIEKNMKDFEKSVQDLQSKDDKTKKQAQDKLDKMVGEKNRKEMDIQKGLQSNDPEERKAAQDKLKDLQQKAGAGKDDMQPKGNGQGGKKPDPKEVAQAMKDLQSPDKAKREEAKKKLDEQFGQGAGDKAEQLQNDLKSSDPKKRAAAEKELNDLKKKADELAKNNPQKNSDGAGGKKPDPKEVAQAMKDLQSPDKAKREEAKKKLDEQFGQGAGDKAEQLQNDLKSSDPKKRAAAEKELNDLKKKADELAKNNPQKHSDGAGGKKPDPKEVEKALDDLASGDPKKREQAKKKLDEQLGQGAGDKAEKITQDMKSEDFEKSGKARKERDDLLKKAEQLAKKGQPQPKGKKPSQEDIDRLAKKLDDLKSPDEAKRKAAEQDLDRQIGEKARKQLQEAMNDPKKAEEIKKKLDELAQKNGQQDNTGDIKPKGGDPMVPVREAMKEDARNRAKSAELQLEHFERNKDNKEMLDKVGMSQKQYEDFLTKFRNNVAKLKKEADDLEKAASNPKGPATTNISGGGRVESKGGASGAASSGGPTVPAPGYSDALRDFQKAASKVNPKR